MSRPASFCPEPGFFELHADFEILEGSEQPKLLIAFSVGGLVVRFIRSVAYI